jgi:hypothetical protein
LQPLKVALPDYPDYSPDSAETTAVSPDGKTLLILTSGYNLNLDPAGNFQPQDSGEYVFVYDISKPSLPVKKQVCWGGGDPSCTRTGKTSSASPI